MPKFTKYGLGLLLITVFLMTSGGMCNPNDPARVEHYIMATAANGGSISPAGSVKLDDGSSQTFTITPNSGYSIADVKVDAVSVGTVATYTFINVTADHLIEAAFAVKPADASDFVGTWMGPLIVTAVDGENNANNVRLVLALGGNSLTGTFYVPGESTLSITGNITVANGTLSFNIPKSPMTGDCVNWNVRASATLNSSFTTMAINASGTVCSSSGGKQASFSGTLTKQ